MHSFNLFYGHRNALNAFQTIMSNKEYLSTYPNHSGYHAQVGLRRVRLFSVQVPSTHIKDFFNDLAPFNVYSKGKVKKSLKFVSSVLSKLAGFAALSHKSIDKRKAKNKNLNRTYINVFLMGKTEVDKMEKLYFLVEGAEDYVEEFLKYLETKKYKLQLPNNPTLEHNLEIKEVRLMDISVFESTKSQLVCDLTPFKSIDSVLPSWVKLPFSFIRKRLGFTDPIDSIDRKSPFGKKRDLIDIYSLGGKQDVWMQDKDYLDGMLPDKQELLKKLLNKPELSDAEWELMRKLLRRPKAEMV